MQNKQQSQRRGIGRRTFLKGATAGTLAFGIGSSEHIGVVGNTRAVPVGGGIVSAKASAKAANYLVSSVKDFFTGPSVSSDKYNSLSDSQLHTQVYQDAVEMQAVDESLITTMRNLLSNSQNAAFSDGKVAAIKSMNNGASLSTVKSDGTTKVDQFYKTQELNVLDHWEIQLQKCINIDSQIDNSGLNTTNVIDLWKLTQSSVYEKHPHYNSGSAGGTRTYTLVNGTDIEVDKMNVNVGDQSTEMYVTPNASSSVMLFILPPGTQSKQILIDVRDYYKLLNDISSKHSSVVSELETWIDGVYSNYTAGDIDPTKLVNANDLSNAASDEEGFSYAGADLALLGISGADHKYQIELLNDDKVVTGTLYAPNRTNPLEFNKEYSPGTLSTSVFLAYETVNAEGNNVSDITELKQNFKILSGVDNEGNEVSQMTFSKKNQQTTDTDIQKVKEEMQQLQELQNDLNKQQKELVEEGSTDNESGGGGIFSGDNFLTRNYGGLPGYVYAAGGTVLLYFSSQGE